jgi:hypothetical protein
MNPEFTEQYVIELYEFFDMEFIAKKCGATFNEIKRIIQKHGIKIRFGGSSGTSRITTGISKVSHKYGFADVGFGRILALITLGGKCAKCGCSDYRVLQFNHVNGERAKEKSYKFYADICLGKAVAHLEIRCANCNVIHEFERGKRPNLSKIIGEKTGQPTEAFFKAKQDFEKIRKYLARQQ